ncbi:MAG: DegT/DnrJ/EryC1/StrS family aminotransferase [Oscillospiraceae bacterium]|jgi:pyridoxal phosphate-dependent aminotransferase EpsN|nr:DegT/DnrJ/EryC1/StrS family aminotransferase [Oscillospiraceae bacterium]
MSRLESRIYLSPPHMNGLEPLGVQQVFESNWVAPAGPQIGQFERDLMQYAALDGYEACALSSGTAAIHLGLRALGVQPGDRVFCSDLTFAGGAFPILYECAVPVFIDSGPADGDWCAQMDPAALERALREHAAAGILPKAVIIADLYGQSAPYDRLLPLLEAYGIPVLEDAAEALGAHFRGQPCGSFGRIGAFSFNGNKIITSSGGGAAVTADPALMQNIRCWSNQAKADAPYYLHEALGFNYRLSSVCAAIGSGQLRTLRAHIARRRTIRARYTEALAGLPGQILGDPPGCQSNAWLSVLRLERSCGVTPETVVATLERDNIEARRAWYPMHCQPIFRDAPYVTAEDGISQSEEFFRRGVCLPSGSAMPDQVLGEVTDRLKAVLRQNCGVQG